MKRRRFQNADLMETAINRYKQEFENAEGTIMPSLAGLCLALGFRSPDALRRYEGYTGPDYKSLIDDARLWIEAYLAKYGKTAFDKAHVAMINSDWRDKQELTVKQANAMSPSEMLAKMDAVLEEKQINALPGELVEEEDWTQ